MPRRSVFNCNREVNLRYILQGNGDNVNRVLHTDYFHSDLIEKTTHVKRLPRSYIINSNNSIAVPFVKSTTKPCRYPIPHPEHEGSVTYHVQDQIEFYEVITYYPKLYIEVQPNFFPILRIRKIGKVIRRPVYDPTDDHCTETNEPLQHDPLFIKHWVDQHKRDLLKYQEGNGIRLIIATREQVRAQYWEQQASLSKVFRYSIDDTKTETRLIKANNLSLANEYYHDIHRYYKYSTVKPAPKPDDNFPPLVQEFWHVRSVVNGLPETLVAYRAPNNIHRDYSSYPVVPNDIYNLYGATILNNSYRNHQGSYEVHRQSLHGVSPGRNNHFDFASFILY